MIIYLNEHYYLKQFLYDIQLIHYGDYILLMEFIQIWFNRSNVKFLFN